MEGRGGVKKRHKLFTFPNISFFTLVPQRLKGPWRCWRYVKRHAERQGRIRDRRSWEPDQRLICVYREKL